MIIGIVLGVVAFVSVVVALILLAKFEPLQIRDVNVEGSVSVPSSEVVSRAMDMLDGYYAGLIPRSNVFFYPKQEMTEAFIAKYPRLSGVNLSRSGRTLVVTLIERAPVAVICGNSAVNAGENASGDDECFFSDETGYLLALAPKSSGSGDLSSSLYRTIHIDKPLVVGVVPISAALLADMLHFADRLSSKLGYPIQSLTLRSDGDIIIDTEANTDIFLRSTDSFDTTYRNLSLFLEEARVRARVKKTSAVFSQIDLRYGNAVYYKIPSTATTTASESFSTSDSTSGVATSSLPSSPDATNTADVVR